MPNFYVYLEATIRLTVVVEADDLDQARSMALDQTETPGLSRLEWDEQESEVRQVCDESGKILWDVNW